LQKPSIEGFGLLWIAPPLQLSPSSQSFLFAYSIVENALMSPRDNSLKVSVAALSLRLETNQVLV
jgi:hypothetical protein